MKIEKIMNITEFNERMDVLNRLVSNSHNLDDAQVSDMSRAVHTAYNAAISAHGLDADSVSVTSRRPFTTEKLSPSESFWNIIDDIKVSLARCENIHPAIVHATACRVVRGFNYGMRERAATFTNGPALAD
jgi:hypothetical protein